MDSSRTGIEGSENFNSGSVVFGNNGTLAPGNSAGELTVTGDLGLGGTSILEIEIGGRSASTEYDVLTVNGDLSLDGDLDVSFLSSFYQDINSSDTFSIVYADSINGSFDNLDVNNRVITSDGRGSFFVAIGGTTIVLEQFELISIPEPSSFALFLALSSTLTLCKRKRKR